MVGTMARDGARYRIGPLTLYADTSDLEGWLKDAGEGETYVYAIGPALGRNAVVPALARRWSDEGKVRLHREGCNYIMKRRIPAPDAVASGEREPNGEELRLLDVIQRLADEGKSLPVLELLAEMAGLSGRQAAAYRLKLLEDAKLVRVTQEHGVRVAEVIASGAKTALPQLPRAGAAR